MNRVIETIPTETMDALTNWHWPGNVRELENFIERSVILTEGTALRSPLADLKAASHVVESSLESTERQHIIRVLRESEWDAVRTERERLAGWELSERLCNRR